MSSRSLSPILLRGSVLATALAVLCFPTASFAAGHTHPGDRDRHRAHDHPHDHEHDRTGPYARLGVNIGAPRYENERIDGEAGGGVSLGAGYRALPWLAGEFAFDYLGGADVEVRGNEIGELDFWSLTLNAKAYPFAAFHEPVLPHWIEPYAVFGLGGGRFEFERSGRADQSDGTFVVRLGGGFDFPIDDAWSAYTDGSFHFTDDALEGVGIFSVGITRRFP